MGLWEGRRLRPWLVSVAVLRGAGEVLLMKRRNPPVGAWCQVAGKIKSGETAVQAALRALAEETGFAPESFWLTDFCEQFFEPDTDEVVIAPVFLARVAADAQPQLNAEHSEARWVLLPEAQEMVSFIGQRQMLRHVEEEFVNRTPTEHLRISL